MNLISINDRYTLPVPNGFHVVEETDKQKLNVMGGGDWMGLSDPGRHLLMTLGWKKVGKLPSKLLKTQGLASAMEKKIRGGLRSMWRAISRAASRGFPRRVFAANTWPRAFPPVRNLLWQRTGTSSTISISIIVRNRKHRHWLCGRRSLLPSCDLPP